MTQTGRLILLASMLLAILTFVAFPVPAQAQLDPPYFGPPGQHADTLPGRVDINGTGPASGEEAYPRWDSSIWANYIYFQSPWSACAVHGLEDFLVQPQMTGAVPRFYDRGRHWGRTFTVDNFDADGDPIGGTYDGGFGWPNDQGTLTLEKSDPSQTPYDQVRLQGTTSSGAVNTLLSLVEQDGYIGVANIASLGVINPCGTATANSQIWVPLGTAHGWPTVIGDLDGDGVPDPEFMVGPPLSGGALPPIPTLTEWGLAALALMLLTVGILALRKRGIGPGPAPA